jgi:hypothetical protein
LDWRCPSRIDTRKPGHLEHALALSRAPIFVAVMGLRYARAGHVDYARRLLDELEERASRGEEIARLYKRLYQSDTPEFKRAAV